MVPDGGSPPPRPPPRCAATPATASPATTIAVRSAERLITPPERCLRRPGRNSRLPDDSRLTIQADMIATLLALALAAPPQAPPAPATGSIAGVVQEASLRTPIADARVTLVGQGVRETTTADHAGRFTFSSLPPGTYRIAAERETFALDPAGLPAIRLEARATATVVVAMQRAGIIVGDVRDER